MPLNFNYANCADEHAVDSDENWPITETLIFATMPIGIHEITEKTVDEFIRRLTILQAANGGLYHQYGQSWFITPEEVRARIGLNTNASTITKTQFAKNMVSLLERNGNSRLRTQDSRREAARAELVSA